MIPGLSKAESLVVIEAVKGGTRKDIGKALNISWMTVRSHLYAAYAILNVRNRIQLALKVAEIKKNLTPKEGKPHERSQLRRPRVTKSRR